MDQRAIPSSIWNSGGFGFEEPDKLQILKVKMAASFLGNYLNGVGTVTNELSEVADNINVVVNVLESIYRANTRDWFYWWCHSGGINANQQADNYMDLLIGIRRMLKGGSRGHVQARQRLRSLKEQALACGLYECLRMLEGDGLPSHVDHYDTHYLLAESSRMKNVVVGVTGGNTVSELEVLITARGPEHPLGIYGVWLTKLPKNRPPIVLALQKYAVEGTAEHNQYNISRYSATKLLDTNLKEYWVPSSELRRSRELVSPVTSMQNKEDLNRIPQAIGSTQPSEPAHRQRPLASDRQSTETTEQDHKQLQKNTSININLRPSSKPDNPIRPAPDNPIRPAPDDSKSTTIVNSTPKKASTTPPEHRTEPNAGSILRKILFKPFPEETITRFKKTLETKQLAGLPNSLPITADTLRELINEVRIQRELWGEIAQEIRQIRSGHDVGPRLKKVAPELGVRPERASLLPLLRDIPDDYLQQVVDSKPALDLLGSACAFRNFYFIQRNAVNELQGKLESPQRFVKQSAYFYSQFGFAVIASGEAREYGAPRRGVGVLAWSASEDDFKAVLLPREKLVFCLVDPIAINEYIEFCESDDSEAANGPVRHLKVLEESARPQKSQRGVSQQPGTIQPARSANNASRGRPSNSKKSGGPVAYDFVNVIQGDPSIHDAAAESGRSHSRSTPDHRWTVRGHYRRQWYGSTQSHEKIWIESHVSGPSGKPVTTVQRIKVMR